MTEANLRLYADSADDLIAEIGDELRNQPGGVWQIGPGTVLGGMVRLFGRLGQIIITRVNEIPEQHFRAFLNEAEIDTLPPLPAHVEVTFLPAIDGPAEIPAPAGTQVATRPSGGQPALIFETERAITVTPAELVKCVAVDPINYCDHTASVLGEGAEGFSAFAGEIERDRILYLGELPSDKPAEDLMLAFPAQVDRRYVKLSLIFDPQPPEDDVLAATDLPLEADRWRIRWLYWNGQAWVDLATSGAQITEDLHWFDACGGAPTATSRVDFVNMPDLAPTKVNNTTARWLAVQLTGGATRACLPALQDIRIERTIHTPGAQPASIDAAFAAIQGGKVFVPLKLDSPFEPLGPQPGALDTFYLRMDDALSKAGAIVTVDLDLPDLPDKLDDTSELEQLKIVWEYSSKDDWTELGYSGRGCPALEHMDFEEHRDLGLTPFPSPVLGTNLFTRQKYLEFAVPSGYGDGPFPRPFDMGKQVADIYTGARFVQFPLPDGCKDVSEDLLINGCYKPTLIGSSFRDKTCALTTNGIVQFRVPQRIEASAFVRKEVNGQEGYWIRARLAGGSYNVPRSIRQFPLGPRIDLPPEVHAPVVTKVSVTFADYEVQRGPERIQQCLGKTDQCWSDLRATLDRGKPVRPFTSSVEQQALYLGFLPLDPDSARPAFPANAWLELRIPVAEDDALHNTPDVVYQYWNGKAWRPLRSIDDTLGLRRTGYFGFYAPTDHQASEEFGQRAYWLRVIPVGAVSSTPPKVGGILLNTVPAVNAETITGEILGSSDGEKNHRFLFSRSPVLPDVQIEVLEREAQDETGLISAAGATSITLPRVAMQDHAIWVAWQRVDSFYGAGPESRCFVLDQANGAIVFGDGKAGKIPSPGIDNIRAACYRTHRGQAGNVLPRAITDLRSTQGPLGNVDRVVNYAASSGGGDVESIERVKRRGPQVIKHRGRAVTQEDYQWLALEAQGVARVYPLATTDANGRAQPGWVTLVIVPAFAQSLTAEKRALPSQALLKQVRQYVEQRVLANLSDAEPSIDGLHLRGPEYVEVSVNATIVTTRPEEADEVKLAVMDRVEAFLHPLSGGPERTGWVLGRDVYVSEVAAEIERVTGVDHVVNIGLSAPSLQLWQMTLHDATAQEKSPADGRAGSTWLPAGSQISLIDERIKLIVAEPVAGPAKLVTLAVYGFKAGDAALVAGMAGGAAPVPVRLALVNQAKGFVQFAAPFELQFPVTAGQALEAPDGSIRLPIRNWQTETADDGSVRITGAGVRTLAKDDLVGLVHADDRRRIHYPLVVQEVTDGAKLGRIYVPASHLVCSGSHTIEVTLENNNGDPTAQSG